MRVVSVYNLSRGCELAAHVEVASTLWARGRGLLGRSRLAPGHGLWIQPSRAVHTCFMPFAIDVVGLDAEWRVVRLWPELRPWRCTAVSRNVCRVLELAAGEILERGLTLGDRLA